jgi:hypothetical protein
MDTFDNIFDFNIGFMPILKGTEKHVLKNLDNLTQELLFSSQAMPYFYTSNVKAVLKPPLLFPLENLSGVIFLIQFRKTYLA